MYCLIEKKNWNPGREKNVKEREKGKKEKKGENAKTKKEENLKN